MDHVHGLSGGVALSLTTRSRWRKVGSGWGEGAASFKWQHFFLSDTPPPCPFSLRSHVILKAHSSHHLYLKGFFFLLLKWTASQMIIALPKDCLGLYITCPLDISIGFCPFCVTCAGTLNPAFGTTVHVSSRWLWTLHQRQKV